MGRKGGGRAAFMKAAQARNLVDSSSDGELEIYEAVETENIHSESEMDEKLKVSEVSAGEQTNETKGQMTQRHKREMKALKEKVKRMGKKGKEEGVVLLKEMEERHRQELQAPEDARRKTVEEMTISFYSTGMGEQRKTKAQKRREKMMKEEIKREQRIAEENEAMGESEREAEEKALQAKLALSSLAIKDIPSDGHCLYRSIADQIQALPDQGSQISQVLGTESNNLDFLELRKICAHSLRSHKHQFIHFVTENDLTEQKDCSPDAMYESYCCEVEDTAAWGGQLEIQALSLALELHIRIHTALMDTIETGLEYSSNLSTINICYLRHAYGLGEHYQSTTATCSRQESSDS